MIKDYVMNNISVPDRDKICKLNHVHFLQVYENLHYGNKFSPYYHQPPPPPPRKK